MVRDSWHNYDHLFCAICPARGIGTVVITPGVNTEAMSKHLTESNCRVSASAREPLICDGAGMASAR